MLSYHGCSEKVIAKSMIVMQCANIFTQAKIVDNLSASKPAIPIVVETFENHQQLSATILKKKGVLITVNNLKNA